MVCVRQLTEREGGGHCVSWHFLQGQEAVSWEGSCLDGAPSALLSLIPTVDESYCNAKPTYTYRGFQSGTMCEPSTADRGADTSTSLAADFPARTYRPQDAAPDSTEPNQDYGKSLHASSGKCSPRTSSSKTPRCYALEDLCESSKILPPAGITRAGMCWALPTSAPRTRASACGSWPTPTTRRVINDHALASQEWGRKRNWQGVLGLPGLMTSQNGISGKVLNPQFVEALMGWPLGWTALEPLATDRFQQWLQWHGKF